MNRVMIVTGASRGIGAETAVLGAAAGYAVAVNYQKNREAAQAIVRRIAEAGGKAIAVGGDVSNEADVLRLFDTVDRELGKVTALVNNAGIVAPAMTVEQMSVERITRMFAVNVTGSFLCAREAIKRMSKRRGGMGGAIVNLSSVAARLGGSSEYVDYAAAKGAIDTFTIGLAREAGPDGIRVNAVRPGIIRTEIHIDPTRVERVGPTAPLQRAGEPDEVARTVVWLLSDEASYVTGALVDVTGGR